MLKPNIWLRPRCRAKEQIFQWKGINKPPSSTINNPVIRWIAFKALQALLKDTKGPSAAIKKYHTFCDIFSIAEVRRLPASFEMLHSFALWAVTDPTQDIGLTVEASESLRFKPVSVLTAKKYLSGIRAWHIVQGWPEPLSEGEHKKIDWSLWGLQNVFGSRSQPIRPPVTIPMLRALKLSLDLNDTFDACV